MKRTAIQRKTPLRATPKPSIAIKPHTKKCAVKTCRTVFTTFSSFVRWCSPDCGAELAVAALAKKKTKEAAEQRKVERAKDREQKLALKPLHYWAKRAETKCNAYIRERDKGEPCISCGTYDAPVWHAGHCYTVAARPDIRYHEDNIHLQCPKCNTYQGGMVGEYKRRVVSKIGQERFDALEYVNPAFKKTREYYQEIEAFYDRKLKELKGKANA